MAEVDKLLVRIEAETAQLRRELARAHTAVGDTSKRIDTSLQKIDGAVERANRAITRFGTVFATVMAGLAVREFVQVNSEFQRLQGVLVTLTGSVAEADRTFDVLRQFGRETPSQLQDVVTAFARLKSMGLDPSVEALRSYGNTAAAMGMDLMKMVEAVADATTGEFERLKDFGIRASAEGDRVKFTFQGVTTEVGKNAREIEQYLLGIGNVQFAGAMDQQSKTLGVAMTNLRDSISEVLYEIGEGGAGAAIADMARELGGLADGAQNTARAIGSVLGDAIRAVTDGLRFAINHVRELASLFAGLIAMRIGAALAGIAVSMMTFVRSALAATTAMGALNAVMLANPIGLVAASIGAATAALVYFHDKTVTIGDTTATVGQLMVMVWNSITGVIGNAAEAVWKLAEGLSAVVRGDFDQAMQSWQQSGRAMIDAATAPTEAWRKMREQIEQAKEAADDVAAAPGAVAAGGAAGAAGADNVAAAEADKLTKALKEQSDVYIEARNNALDRADQMQLEIDLYGKSAAEQARMRTEWELVNAAMRQYGQLTPQIMADIRAVANDNAMLAQRYDDVKRAAEEAMEAERERAEVLARGQALHRRVMTPDETRAASAADIAGLYGAGAINDEDFQRALADLREQTEGVGSAAHDLGLTFESAFEDAIVNGAKLSDVLKGIEQDLIRIAARKLVTEPLAGAIGGLFGGAQSVPWRNPDTGQTVSTGGGGGLGGLFARLFHSGGVVGGPAASRLVSSALFEGAQRLHSGGVAGLRGGEVPAILQRGEIVLPKGSGGVAPVTVNVINNGGAQVDVQQSNGGRQIDVVIDEMVAGAVRSGGRTTQALRQMGIKPATVAR